MHLWLLRFPKEFNITPMTYIFPEDEERFETDRETEDAGVLYILKPVAASCGRGIKVMAIWLLSMCASRI